MNNEACIVIYYQDSSMVFFCYNYYYYYCRRTLTILMKQIEMLCFFAISESEKAKCRIFQSTAPLVVVRVESIILS